MKRRDFLKSAAGAAVVVAAPSAIAHSEDMVWFATPAVPVFGPVTTLNLGFASMSYTLRATGVSVVLVNDSECLLTAQIEYAPVSPLLAAVPVVHEFVLEPYSRQERQLRGRYKACAVVSHTFSSSKDSDG